MWFPALLVAPLAAQRVNPVDRHIVAAGLWSEARYNYAYWDGVRANWDSAFAATVTSIESRPVPTDLQFFRQLRRWGALLHDGQFELLPPATIAARDARPPIGLRSIERRPFIIDYAANDEMRIARPERLAEIIAVQGVPAELWIRDSVLPEIAAATDSSRWARAVEHMLEGERGTALHLLLRLPGGEQRGASVTRSVALMTRWPLERPSLEADTLPDGVIWIRINSFADPDVVAMFDRALGDAPREGLRHRGLILDLRETTWTASGREQGYAILSRLTDRPILTSRWRTPQYRPAYRGPDEPDTAGAWLGAPPDTIWPPVRRERIPTRVRSLCSLQRVRPGRRRISWPRSITARAARSSANRPPAARGKRRSCDSPPVGRFASRSRATHLPMEQSSGTRGLCPKSACRRALPMYWKVATRRSSARGRC